MCQEKEGLTTVTKVLSRQEKKGSAQRFRGGTCLNRTDTIHPVAGDWGGGNRLGKCGWIPGSPEPP